MKNSPRALFVVGIIRGRLERCGSFLTTPYALSVLRPVGSAVKKMINVLRWIAVMPVTILAFGSGLFLSMLLNGCFALLCPQDQMVSGMCNGWWFHYVETIVFCFGGALTAIFVITSAVLVAPSRRVGVASTVFLIGCMFAIKIAIDTSLVAASVAAVLAGFFEVRLIIRRFGKKHRSDV